MRKIEIKTSNILFILFCVLVLTGIFYRSAEVDRLNELLQEKNNLIGQLETKLNKRNWTDYWTKELLIKMVDNNRKAYYVRNEIMYYNKDMSREEASYQALWIYTWSGENRVDPYLTTAVFVQESNLMHIKNEKVVTSSKGAKGIGQLMPNTARLYDVDALIFEENVKGTTLFLADLQNMYSDIEGILGHYNGGSRPYDKIRDYKETREYVAIVKHIYESMTEKYG